MMMRDTRQANRLALALALLVLSEPAFAAGLTMREHMEIQSEPVNDADLGRFPSVEIDTIQATVAVSDRMQADEAFNRPFIDALREGMKWYLKQRGLRIVDNAADLRCTGSIDSYEGWKGWGHWGVEIHMTVKFFRGTSRILTDDLHSFLKYRSDDDVRDEVRPKYVARHMDITFREILFTRVGIDLSEKMIALMKENAELLANLGTDQAQAAVGSPGRLSVDATVANAEVFVNGDLVGTTPVADLVLPAKMYSIEVHKRGFKIWKRDVSVLSGATSRITVELEPQ